MNDEAGAKKITRRRFLRIAGGTIAAAAVGSVVDGVVVEPNWIDVSRPTLTLPGLGAGWDGARIAHLTDLHCGRWVSPERVARAVQLANAARPDVIVLTGDLVSRRSAITADLTSALAGCSAPLGVFSVFGNHDHWTDVDALRDVLAAAGVRMIDNDHIVLTCGGDALTLAGVGDPWEGPPDLSAAFDGAPESAPRLLLCHNPDYADDMPARPRVDFMLCGHTHGGQVKIPFGPRPMLPIRNPAYGAGRARGPRCPLYVSRGVGLIGPPVRFNCRPEIPVYTLRRAD